MDYKISSDKLEHPLIKALLKEIIPVFENLDIRFFIIGATARDIIMELNGQKSARRTQDIDIAIAVNKWEEFAAVEKAITGLDNFTKDAKQKQRFLYLNEFQVDIVPFGGIANEKHKIFWPPDQSFAMTVLGFDEAQQHVHKVEIDGELTIEIVSLTGIFILKLVAWRDRHHKNNKDADDMGFILQNYLNIHDERAANEHYDQVYGLEDFTVTKAGAALVGIDVNLMVSANQESKNALKEIIEKEVAREENSILFNQIIETNHIKYEEVFESFQIILEKLS
ncbi:nucleotidyl transferase AbiEii/AbiGii toxin family protein [Pedobacter psychrodurus]|uniref:nucleotidyl transferase AbiEii/AbiGii toxin family protein n=1 Tax=Pedobacter psychrodurus TaxID=2530456 RepID=UPI00292CB2EC|nr:nucleotidyl transferase AbiEii/AbiGii toxin family protein [Pedobacter psychrodurus]